MHTPTSTPLPTLVFPDGLATVPVPTPGHASMEAAKALRILAKKTPRTRLISGRSMHRGIYNPIGDGLGLFVFPDKTLLLTAEHDGGHLVFPQVFVQGGSGVLCAVLRGMPAAAKQAICTTIAQHPPLAVGFQGILTPGHHWPGWAPLSGREAASVRQQWHPKTLDLHLQALAACLPNPPAQRDTITYTIHGRMVLAEGYTPPKVHIEGARHGDDAWFERLTKGAQALFSHPDVLPAWVALGQGLSTHDHERSISPKLIHTGAIPLLHSLTAHQRLGVARTLPAGIVA